MTKNEKLINQIDKFFTKEKTANRNFWHRNPVEPTAAEVVETWLKWMVLDGRRESTIRGYRQIVGNLLARWPELKLSEFTDEHITGVIEEARPPSRQSRRGAFSNLFGWAYGSKRIPRNPMHHVPNYKQTLNPPIDVFTEAECKVLCALPHPDGALMALLLGSGIRKGEARQLTVKRCDLANAEIHIVEGAKGGSTGVIPIEHKLVQRLAEYFLLEGLNPDDHLWYCHPGGSKDRRHDRAIADGALHQWWVRCVAAAGIPYRKLHTTRHSYATEWRRRGLAMDDVSFLLRHADSRTTGRVYVHLKAIDIRRKMEALQS